jgi:regulator of replication initiation timing
MLEGFDPNTIQDLDGARQAILKLFNLVEELASENRALREENQRLRDEINRLKGEQGKPQIKPNRVATSSAPQNHSSERERHKPQVWTKTSKIERIKINRAEMVQVDRAVLPADAEFKGYEEVVVQDIELKTDNVLFRKESFYSKVTGKTYTAKLPPAYKGQFGPGVKALTIVLYHGANMREPKVSEFLEYVGVFISPGEVSNLLIKDTMTFMPKKTRCMRPECAAVAFSIWMRPKPGSRA